MTKSDQIWEIEKENTLVGIYKGVFRASGGNRTRTDIAAQGIFVLLWLSPPDKSVRSLDYSFIMKPIMTL